MHGMRDQAAAVTSLFISYKPAWESSWWKIQFLQSHPCVLQKILSTSSPWNSYFSLVTVELMGEVQESGTQRHWKDRMGKERWGKANVRGKKNSAMLNRNKTFINYLSIFSELLMSYRALSFKNLEDNHMTGISTWLSPKAHCLCSSF